MIRRASRVGEKQINFSWRKINSFGEENICLHGVHCTVYYVNAYVCYSRLFDRHNAHIVLCIIPEQCETETNKNNGIRPLPLISLRMYSIHASTTLHVYLYAFFRR